MTLPQLTVFAVLSAALGLFVRGRWRYDVVGMMALVISGNVPARERLAGFGEPAVIAVAALLVISCALEKTGLVNLLAVSRQGQRLREHLTEVNFRAGDVLLPSSSVRLGGCPPPLALLWRPLPCCC